MEKTKAKEGVWVPQNRGVILNGVVREDLIKKVTFK